jgi:hypothetical protein
MRKMTARRCGLLLVAMCCSVPALADWIDAAHPFREAISQ